MEENGSRGVKVPADEDRFQRVRKVFGVMPFAVKVTARDTGGKSLVIEQANAYRGGPPRHVHHDQEEWFYVIAGEYLVEVGGETHRLGPGDAVLAPRGVPHGWALASHGAGRMLIAFFPAGEMEAFFDEATNLGDMPPHEELRQLFSAHGMTITGPPLELAESRGA